MTDKQLLLLGEVRQLQTLIQLETESFYLFAKILLDKIALFLQYYFGQAHNISLVSHDKLTKSYEQFGIVKGLVYPDGFAENLQLLKSNICDYRDKQISHQQNLRVVEGLMVNNSTGEMKIAPSFIYPKSNELFQESQSRELSELVTAIEGYIQQVIAVIELNRAQTRLKLKD